MITLVERSSRFVLLAPLLGRHTAELARMSLNEMIVTLPLSLRKSIIWDRGNEMAQHARFKTETGIPIYFCDPVPLAARHQREHQRAPRQYCNEATLGATTDSFDRLFETVDNCSRRGFGC